MQDVVTANPDTWSFDPFKLSVEGDKLQGRGVTDCLGHVALVTELFIQLAEHRPKLTPTLIAVFISNEENATVSATWQPVGVYVKIPSQAECRHCCASSLHVDARCCAFSLHVDANSTTL